jgi:hypothetical protein
VRALLHTRCHDFELGPVTLELLLFFFLASKIVPSGLLIDWALSCPFTFRFCCLVDPTGMIGLLPRLISLAVSRSYLLGLVIEQFLSDQDQDQNTLSQQRAV